MVHQVVYYHFGTLIVIQLPQSQLPWPSTTTCLPVTILRLLLMSQKRNSERKIADNYKTIKIMIAHDGFHYFIINFWLAGMEGVLHTNILETAGQHRAIGSLLSVWTKCSYHLTELEMIFSCYLTGLLT